MAKFPTTAYISEQAQPVPNISFHRKFGNSCATFSFLINSLYKADLCLEFLLSFSDPPSQESYPALPFPIWTCAPAWSNGSSSELHCGASQSQALVSQQTRSVSPYQNSVSITLLSILIAQRKDVNWFQSSKSI